jgi:hypothetical protein
MSSDFPDTPDPMEDPGKLKKFPWYDPNLPDDIKKRLKYDEVLRRTLPPFKQSKAIIAKAMKISVSQVYNIRRELREAGKLVLMNVHQNVIPEKNIQLYQDIIKSEFGQIESVKVMIDGIRKKVKNFDRVVSYFYKVCKTIQKHPDEFKENEEHIKSLVKEFEEKFYRGEAYYIDPNNAQRWANKEDTSVEHYLNSIRVFRRENHIQMSSGFLKSKKKTKGKYKRVKLTDKERQLGIDFMRKISEIFMIFFILNTEIGTRIETLITLKPKFDRHTIDVDGRTCEFYVGEIYEEKQEDSESGGYFQKIIMTPEGRNIITKLEYGKSIFLGTVDWRIKKKYNNALRSFYISIGKLKKDTSGKIEKAKKGTEEWYYNIRPSHSGRHSTVHFWLRSTGNDMPTIGGMFWDDQSTGHEYYAKQDVIEGLLQEGRCNYCNPQSVPDPNYNYFCKFSHAVAWYNHGLNKNQVLAANKPSQ